MIILFFIDPYYVVFQENELVRDIFGLGAPIPLDAIPQQKISRSERVSTPDRLVSSSL